MSAVFLRALGLGIAVALLLDTRRPGHVGTVDTEFTSSQVEPHAEVTSQGVEGMLEGRGSVLLEKVVAEPGESVAIRHPAAQY